MPEGRDQAGEPKKRARRTPREAAAIGLNRAAADEVGRLSPTERLAEATRDRIDALEEDKRLLRGDVERLRGEITFLKDEVASLGAARARLDQALGAATLFNWVASVLITVGGSAVSYAAFIDAEQKRIADLGIATLVCGLVVSLAIAWLGWAAKKRS